MWVGLRLWVAGITRLGTQNNLDSLLQLQLKVRIGLAKQLLTKNTENDHRWGNDKQQQDRLQNDKETAQSQTTLHTIVNQSLLRYSDKYKSIV